MILQSRRIDVEAFVICEKSYTGKLGGWELWDCAQNGFSLALCCGISSPLLFKLFSPLTFSLLSCPSAQWSILPFLRLVPGDSCALGRVARVKQSKEELGGRARQRIVEVGSREENSRSAQE